MLACWEGVFVLDRGETGTGPGRQLGTGNQESRPFKGSSEVKVGRLESGVRYIATIEPWHGYQVVVYTRDATSIQAPGCFVERGEAIGR